MSIGAQHARFFFELVPVLEPNRTMAVAVDVATADKTTLPAVCDGQMTGSIVRRHKKIHRQTARWSKARRETYGGDEAVYRQNMSR